MRVAQILTECGADTVEVSRKYLDSETGKVREIDAHGVFRWTGVSGADCSISVVVECKLSPSAPFVGFYKDATTSEIIAFDSYFVHKHGGFVGLVEPLEGLWQTRAPFGSSAVATHIHDAILGAKGKKAENEDGKETSDWGVQQAISAADGIWEECLQGYFFSPIGDKPAGAIAQLAVVVTHANLFKCWLDGNNEIRVEQSSSLSVWSRNKKGEKVRALILNEDTFTVLARNLRECADLAGQDVEARQARR